MVNGDIPIGWEWNTLGDVCQPPQYGWTTSATSNGKVHLLRTTDITSGAITWENVPFCAKEPSDINKYLLKDGDIVISRAGSVGYSILIKKPVNAIFASYLIRFRPLINEKYVSYFLQSPDYWQSISEKRLGIAIPNVNASKLKQISIPVPPLPEQQRIVERIESLFTQLDAGVAGLKRVKEALKRYKASVLKAACEGRLVPQDPSDELVSNLIDQVAKEKSRLIYTGLIQNTKPLLEIRNEEKTFKLPSGWKWIRLNDVCSDIIDIAHKMPKDVDQGVKFISAKDLIDNGRINFAVDVKRISEKDYEALVKRVKPKRNDIIYSRIGARLGKARIVETDEKFMVSYSCCVIRPIIVNVKYVSYYLDSGTVLEQARTHTKSIGVPDLGMAQIKSFVIALPPLMEQHRIVVEIERRLSVVQELEQTIEADLKRAARLRQAILKRAFDGKLL